MLGKEDNLMTRDLIRQTPFTLGIKFGQRKIIFVCNGKQFG